jgi:hypothetical protein
MATWPNTLPSPRINTIQEAPADNLIRTRMDRGPDKVRRRTTANAKKISFRLLLSKAQRDALITFYETTTFSGADAFTYVHPIDSGNVSARFVSPPAFTDLNGQYYNATVELEILP